MMRWLINWLHRHDAPVLAALSDGEMTGVELKKAGVLRVWSCYGILHSMEERGLITSRVVQHVKIGSELMSRRAYRVKVRI